MYGAAHRRIPRWGRFVHPQASLYEGWGFGGRAQVHTGLLGDQCDEGLVSWNNISKTKPGLVGGWAAEQNVMFVRNGIHVAFLAYHLGPPGGCSIVVSGGVVVDWYVQGGSKE